MSNVYLEESILVSIHASTQEATDVVSKTYKLEGVSIHASTQEATVERVSDFTTVLFQSTLPRRKRLIS